MATATVTGLTLIENMETAPTITNIGGGPGAATTNDVFIQGSQALGRRAGTVGALRGFGVDFTAVDFTVAGRMLWVWWNGALGADLADTRANGGFRIRVSSTAGGGSNYREYYVGGGDVTRTGNWNRSILDINNLTASATNGTLNVAAVVNVSITYTYPVSTPGGNIPHVVLDAIHYGSVIEVTGGTLGDELTWSDVAAATETATNTWGVLRQPAGSSFYIANGDIQFGSFTGAGSCFLKDEQQIIEWQDQLYYRAGVSSSVPRSFQGISLANSSSLSCSFIDGVQVGTGDDLTGANGSIFQAAPTSLTTVHFRASSSFVQEVKLFGTQLRQAKTEVIFAASSSFTADHQIGGATFSNCNQVVIRAMPIRNSSFQGYLGPSGSLLWGPEINIKNCAFRSNSSSLGTQNAAGIEHQTTGSFSYQGLTFSENQFDILNSTTGQVDITASLGSNPTTVTASNGGTTNILNAVNHTVTDLEAGSRVIWIRVSDDVELENLPETSGEATYQYNYTGDVEVDVQILSLTSRNKIVRVTLGNTDAVLPASQNDDNFYSNPD